ncbi:7-carboxy-7-deazaguanine synthase QueE [bacterium]|nr:7-carboxy-7-deazaguanine synthase QueE [bacterium]
MEVSSKFVPIKEIFTSIQGEGMYAGEKHAFVRFCGCNLKCAYCDTDFDPKDAELYTTERLYKELKFTQVNAISFTGGEPLIYYQFIKDFLLNYAFMFDSRLYLESNGTLYKELNEIISFLDVVAMDIKLESATGQKNKFINNEKFISIAQRCPSSFIKVVFDENITNDEIKNVLRIAKIFESRLILQPKMPMSENINLIEIFDKFYKHYRNVRLVPQLHKFLNLA